MTTEPKPGTEANEAGSELECPKCGLLNPPRSRHCESCGAHLVVRCQSCGHRNERAASHCAKCGHRLHRSVWRRWRKRMFLKNYEFAPWHVGLLIVFVALVFYVVVKIAEFNFSSVFRP